MLKIPKRLKKIPSKAHTKMWAINPTTKPPKRKALEKIISTFLLLPEDVTGQARWKRTEGMRLNARAVAEKRSYENYFLFSSRLERVDKRSNRKGWKRHFERKFPRKLLRESFCGHNNFLSVVLRHKKVLTSKLGEKVCSRSRPRNELWDV